MKSGRILFLISLGGAASLLCLVYLGITIWPHAATTLQNTAHAVSYACAVAWEDITRNQIALAVSGVIFLGMFLAWLGYSAYRTLRMSKKMQFARVPTPASAQALVKAAGIKPSSLRVIADSRAFAMTIGLRQPLVVVSTYALKKLSSAELRAVFEHEAHHVRMREPMQRLRLAAALFWVPFARLRARLRDAYIIASEVEADACVRDQAVLGSALLQLVKPPIAAAGFSPLDARVERLVNPHFKPSYRAVFVFAIAALVVAGNVVAFIPKGIAAVFGEHPSTAQHLSMCREEYERMLQSREQSCGKFSTPQTCDNR